MSIPKKIWKVLDLLNTTTTFFSEKSIENPRLNSELLLGLVLGLKRVDLYVSFERLVSQDELTQFREFVRRRSQREPLQYILGETEFMGLPFRVNRSVLIPRPETEILVEKVLELSKLMKCEKTVIVDIGTGSGCIPVSLAGQLQDAVFYATDISQEALTLAKENSVLNQVESRIEFMQADVFSPWPEILPQKIQILISNPPYIAKNEMEGLQPEVRDFEPRHALTDENNGLRFYERIIDLVSKKEAFNAEYVFLEMSGSQPDKIVQLARNAGFSEIGVSNDLNDIPRVLKIRTHDE